MSVAAFVTNISRGSLHDGRGIRSVVYLKGCTMRCAWCHNPENFAAKPQILWNDSKCIHCGRCLAVCPAHHVAEGEKHLYLREGCTGCGRCAAACPSQALRLCGKWMTPAQAMGEIRRDRAYYRISGGGVTFSGGECLLWPEFLEETARLCAREEIAVTVETALEVPWGSVERLLPWVDFWYVDVKHMDTQKHREYTGCGNERILGNLRQLALRNVKICVRVPLIPGANDDMDNLEKTVRLANACRPSVGGVELLKYNILAGSKYTFLGEDFVSFAEEVQSDERMSGLCRQLNDILHTDGFVFFTP